MIEGESLKISSDTSSDVILTSVADGPYSFSIVSVVETRNHVRPNQPNK